MITLMFRSQFVDRRTIQTWKPSPLEVLARGIRSWDVQEALGRVKHFRSGSYSYKPSSCYMRHLAKQQSKNILLNKTY